ncbi:DUF1579 family protein [bacterium]|nr:DUF1579 family protein [bacterium]
MKHLAMSLLLIFAALPCCLHAQPGEVPDNLKENLQQFTGVWDGTLEQNHENGFTAKIPTKTEGTFILDSNVIQLDFKLVIDNATRYQTRALIGWSRGLQCFVMYEASNQAQMMEARGNWRDNGRYLELKGERTFEDGTISIDHSFEFPEPDVMKIKLEYTDKEGKENNSYVTLKRK